MKCFIRAFLILFVSVGGIFAQTAEKSISEFPPKVEPFKIENGVFFSASTSRDAQKFSSSPGGREHSPKSVVQNFKEALDLIKANHADGKNLNYNDLIKSSIISSLRTLDPHSNFYDAETYREFLTEQRSEYNGIGASIANYTQNGAVETFITSTFPDSPAFHSGLRFGDKIVSVNGENMSGKNSFYVREKIRGQKGTIVRLRIEHAGSGKIETIEIKRGAVPQPSIPDAYLLRPGVGYIDLSQGFNYTTIDEFNIALKDLREQGMNSLILDLRDNTGGIVEQAVKVAEKFIGAGRVILTQRGRFEIDNRTWKSNNRNPETFPLVILANRGSASASEIVIGALQDYDRAVVVGQNTFGKGLVQSLITLPQGGGLTLTTAKYYTPSGRSIQRDYSNGNLYDYYSQKAKPDNSTKNQAPSKTITGRIVYGGNGIAPDEAVSAPALDAAQIFLLDPLFFFVRETVNGRTQNLENYKINRPVQFGRRIRPADFPATEELFQAFKTFLLKNNSAKLQLQQIEANRKFILTRLRYNFSTAAFGSVAANQVLIEEDMQVGKAVNALPRAQNLASAAKKTLRSF